MCVIYVKLPLDMHAKTGEGKNFECALLRATFSNGEKMIIIQKYFHK